MHTYAYNCTRSNATGVSPYNLLYGKHPLLSIDIEFGVMTPDLSKMVTLKYVKELQRRLEYVFRKAATIVKRKHKDLKDIMINLHKFPNWSQATWFW